MFDVSLLKKTIYQTAFTHRSFLNESSEETPSNERLEFLGDAVLSLIISSYLYQRRPDDDEGQLTNLRSYIVKTNSLANAARKLNLGQHLRLSAGEELSGGRENTQLLANTFEALLGAIYSDQGLDQAQAFVEEALLPLYQQEILSGPPKDAKSRLQEQAQSQFHQSPRYKVLSTDGPDHAKKFTVGVFINNQKLGTGHGLSKQVAEEMAAAEAVVQISNGQRD